jgi:hypothetical protein
MAIDWDKFANVAARASSDQDGEAVNAVRLMQRMLKKENMTFVDLAERCRQGRTSAGSSDHIALMDALLVARLDTEQARREAKQAKMDLVHARYDADRAKEEARQATKRAKRAESALAAAQAVKTAADRRATVIALIQDPVNMARSDRDIAAAVGVSPQTVGNLRRKLGIAVTVRTVTRRGRDGQAQNYRIRQ